MFRSIYLFLSLSVAVSVVAAEPLVIQSGSKAVQFVELYTSQGCSSCPPAESWMNKLVDHESLWTELIPLNLHVDYWDYIGWKDPFARKVFSSRQRTYNRVGLTHNVATPGFVVNGRGWNGWFIGQDIPKARPMPGGQLTVIQDASSHTDYQLRYEAGDDDQKLTAHMAVLGFGIEMAIANGENGGRLLKHDFVVVGYSQAVLEHSTEVKGTWLKQMRMPDQVDVEMRRQALVVWLTQGSNPSPVQVAAAWLP